MKNLKSIKNIPAKIPVFPLNNCFHVGFPRSGTTLIDAIINSHSKIEVMEEIPIVDTICQKLNLDNFDLITNKEQKQAKLLYQNR